MMVKDYLVNMNRMDSMVDLNIFPLESYGILVGADWMEIHKVILNCLNRTFTYVDDMGETRIVKGMPLGL